MSLTLRWAGEEDRDLVAETRMYCFGHASGEVESFKDKMKLDVRERPGDWLLAERDGRPVGTATAISLRMWIRGSAFPCQGVAWVGAIKTARRKASAGAAKSPGVASSVMQQILRKAREREQVVSALMPFRSSFYAHFGFGVVERRFEWLVPLSVLPAVDADSVRMYRPEDLPAVAELRQRCIERGQCQPERPLGAFAVQKPEWDKSIIVVDCDSAGAMHGWLVFQQAWHENRAVVRVNEMHHDSPATFMRLLSFIGSLRDQYYWASITLPADMPLNHLLREPHVTTWNGQPHAMNWLRPITRMQMRVLDHKRLIEGMHLPKGASGSAVVAVHESEGEISKFRIDIADGRATVTPSSASAQMECSDRTWAAIVLGDLPASQAAAAGVVSIDERAAQTLQAFSAGPVPFCDEYF